MDDLKIGVYVCNCGTNISHVVDADSVRDYTATLPGVKVARSYRYVCSNPGQEMIIKDIREQGLDRVVVAACSPRMHERTFRKACSTAGLNPYLFEMANIREQCSWVHSDNVAATEKAMALTRAAVQRVARQEPLEGLTAEMCPTTLVLGGGIAGLTAALELARGGYPVVLVERSDRLGGNLARVDLTAPHLDSARDLVQERIAHVRTNPNIQLLLRSELRSLSGFVGNFNAEIVSEDGTSTSVRLGNVVVATGYKEFDASRVTHYGYGKLPNVITSFDLERMLRAGRIETRDGRKPQYVAIIHCVGSRSAEFHGYCSQVCCMTALKYTHEIKNAIPDCYVSDVYIDMHASGKGHEEFYRSGSEAKTLFLMYGKNERPVIRRAEKGDDCEMLIEVNEKLSGELIEIPADLVVLMVGMEARPDSGEIAHLVNISQDKDGWFIESHPKLDPVATTTDGIFIAGTCASPKDIPDSVAQARAAAARILSRIAKGKIEIDGVFAEVDEDRCSGCRMCNELCPYSAIEFDADKRRSHVIPAACKACGVCVAACPSGAIKGRHFTDAQIFAQIEGVLCVTYEPKIVGFLCNWCSYTGADLAGTSRIQYPANVRIIRVMCSARIDPTFVLQALAHGADGVLICGCHPGDCHYSEGNYKAMRRFPLLESLLRSHGVESERIRLEWVSASEGQRFADIVADMTTRLKALGPCRVKTALHTDQMER